MGKCVFVIDEERDTTDLLDLVLSAEGYRVITSTSAQQLAKSLADQKPDLILLGSKIGKTSGFKICAGLKSNPETVDIPVILLFDEGTSYMSTESHNADDFMIKPLNINVVLEITGDYLLAKVINFVPAHYVFSEIECAVIPEIRNLLEG